jgi:hypothetical protein
MELTFNYTKDPNRIIFVTNTYPIGITLLESIKHIVWDYRFHGMTNLLIEDDDGDKFIVAEVDASYNEKFIPYKVFGGACYEWLNHHMRTRPLASVIDPTGDVDLRLYMPKLTYDDKLGDACAHYYNQANEPSPLLQDLLDWITSKLVDIFEQEGIRRHMGNLIVSEPDTSEGVTLPRGVTSLYDGKLWIVQSLQEDMTKVQVTCRFEGMSKSDHILEFVVASGTTMDRASFANTVTAQRSTFQIVDGLRMETVGLLYEGNRTALMDRTPETTRQYPHKYFNHIQRLKFLNLFCSDQFPIDDIPQYFILLMLLKRGDTWMRLALTEKTVSQVKHNLYGNLYLKLMAYLPTIKNDPTGNKREMQRDIFQTRLIHPKFKKWLTRTNITKLPELLRFFDRPDYHPFQKHTKRTCEGRECSIMGGRRKSRKR